MYSNEAAQVLDFTGMSEEEAAKYLLQHFGPNIQLNSVPKKKQDFKKIGIRYKNLQPITTTINSSVMKTLAHSPRDSFGNLL